MKRILVIGSGPAGLSSAIVASRAKDVSVTVIERNSQCGKKLLLTGNGKCNYGNLDQDISHYHSESDSLLPVLINDENLEEVNCFIRNLGIIPFEKNGYLYPFSLQATTMREALLLKCQEQRVAILYDTLVLDVCKRGNTFHVSTDQGSYEFDAVVLAMGSKTYPKTGSDGNGYELAKRLGHSIVPVFPSLVQIVGDGNFTKWNGIRTHVEVSLFEDNSMIKKEIGEIQLTNYGVSGICIFNLSRMIRKGLDEGKQEKILIDFLPFVENIEEFLESQSSLFPNRAISKVLECTLNFKLVSFLLNAAGVLENKTYQELSDREKSKLANILKKYSFLAVDTLGYEHAQVCAGGVSLDELDVHDMSSKIVEGLFVVGELVDIDGDCGGYNLTNAFLTGILAGRGVSKYVVSKKY